MTDIGYLPPAPAPIDYPGLLGAAVSKWAVAGWRPVFGTDFSVTLEKTRRIGWFLNTLAVFATFGLWLIYVIYRAMNRKVDRVTLTVYSDGVVRVSARQ